MKSKIIALAAAASLTLGVGGVALVENSVAATGTVSVRQARAYPVLTLGDTGNPVEVLQRLLNANGARVKIDGSFGYSTRAAVTAYQRSHHLAVDGSVGPATWSKLLPVLKYGAKGPSVTALQQTLRDQGQRPAADGSFGPETRNSVRAFQRSKNLAADGSVGPATWRALLGSESGRPKPASPAPATKKPSTVSTTKAPTSKAPAPKAPTPKSVAPAAGRWVAMDQRKTGRGGSYSCGPTSLAMVLVAKGKPILGYRGPGSYAGAVANLRDVTGTTTSGTGARGMERGLEKYGLHDQRTKNTALALKAAREGKPVILNGWTRSLPWHTTSVGHYIVVTGYDSDTGKYQVIDPWRGRQVEATAQVLTDFGNSKGNVRGRAWREHHIVS